MAHLGHATGVTRLNLIQAAAYQLGSSAMGELDRRESILGTAQVFIHLAQTVLFMLERRYFLIKGTP